MARSFNGTTDQILTTAGAYPPAHFTVSAWVNPSNFTPTYAAVASNNGNLSNGGFGLFITSGKHGAYYFQGASSTQVDPGAATLSANTWYQLAMTWDGTTLRTYVNGVSDGTSTPAGGGNAGSGGALPIGYDDATTGRNIAASIADVAIWNVALSATEITGLAKGIRPPRIRSVSLVGWWPLDGLQSPEPDLSGSANNGTLTGTAKAFGPPFAPFTPRWPQFNEPPPIALPKLQFTMLIPIVATVSFHN